MPALQNSSVRARHPREAQDLFDFPPDQHLLITTPSRVLSWDASGLQTLFKSSESGIAAAAESKDGSGILAGLTAEDDEVRHLSYTADSKKLCFSSKVTNAVQCYSTEGQRLTSPPEMLSSSPVVLAVSPDGGLMITAERDPPIVYLKDLRGTKASTMVVLQTSGTGVTVAAFHPEQFEIFLIGFEDGTLAVHDASRLTDVVHCGIYADQKRVGRAEMGLLNGMHKSTSSKPGGRTKSITGAAFLPHHALRVISVGADGRCRLSDFSGKPTVLRTWHCMVPLTCVATLRATKPAAPPSLHSGTSSVRPTYPANSLIAVGNEHGTVELYASLGLLKQRVQVSRKGQRIISVEWVTGPSPECSARVVPRGTNMVLDIQPAPIHSQRTQTGQHDGIIDPHYLGGHAALRPAATLRLPDLFPGIRKLTFHPDEEDKTSTGNVNFILHEKSRSQTRRNDSIIATPGPKQWAPESLTMPQQPVLLPRKPPIESRVHGRVGKWVIYSVSEDSWSALHEDELWLTSEDEQVRSTARQHHLFRRAQPHQTSRFCAGPGNSGIMVLPGQSTLPQVNQRNLPVPTRANSRRIKRFLPDSDHVRSLFPRTSSLGRGRKKQGKSVRPHGSTAQQPAPHTVPTAAPAFKTISEPRVHGSLVNATADDGQRRINPADNIARNGNN
ncbi:hypothetical protein B0A48_13266 [Cryoendolithus antarcticus]|uniref:Uncharacterized protein n=1 Tax=Cryoendolithus antarcticus TaxID=1507870 RepID=A0A1V8SPF2_9PEZI|nr:hypothetical protein B0A48_13266 [Cryoendolithus antarcticus]